MNKFTFHLVGLPHTNVSNEHSSCAFNQKVKKFGQMMKSLGHTVYLYSSEFFDESSCTTHITCITEEERVACLNGKHYTKASFDYSLPHWKKFNSIAIDGIKLRIQHKDIICVIGGLAHKEIADAFPNNMTVEFGIGYSGTFSKYRVFESYAWMHTIYGQQYGAQAAHGNFFDDVIPSYFDISEFPMVETKNDYFLFIGRITEDKGYRIAIEACKALNKRLIIAGSGQSPDWGEYVGEVDSVRRGELMSRAKAVFVPSTYIEPFGSVAVEAQLCGTPVICTDWGALTETVIEGVTGYRCRTLKEFVDATKSADLGELNYQTIRDWAVAHYSLEVVAEQYQDYFDRLLTLYDNGWYQL